MILHDILDKHGPTQTPRGEWSWTLELPLASESHALPEGLDNMLLSASLTCSEHELRAHVYQKEKPSSWSDEVFGASWGIGQGAWIYKGGHGDGQELSETLAIQTFARYLQAMDVEAVFQEPLAPLAAAPSKPRAGLR